MTQALAPKPQQCLKCSGPIADEYALDYDEHGSAAWRRAFFKGMCWVCYSPPSNGRPRKMPSSPARRCKFTEHFQRFTLVRPCLPEPLKETLEMMSSEGMTVAEISEFYGVSDDTVIRWLRKHSIGKSPGSLSSARYGWLARQFPVHRRHFESMHRSGRQTDFPRTLQGFNEFVKYLGPVPEGMVSPTLGRKDHDLGYLRDNFAWQSRADNTSEMIIRTRTGTTLSDAWKRKISESMKRRFRAAKPC